MDGFGGGGFEEWMGIEDGFDAVDFSDGEWVKWVVRHVGVVIVVLESGCVFWGVETVGVG